MKKYSVKQGHKGDQWFVTEISSDKSIGGKGFKIAQVLYSKQKAEEYADVLNDARSYKEH